MLTVKEILVARPFVNASVVAGKEGLDRQISSVTVAEVPDAANWLQGGELVCTTAYFIRQGLTYQLPWFESLIKGGAMAVAIKTSRFLHTIPHSILEMANHYRIPLIELSPEVSWPDIIESVMQLLSNEQAKLIHSSADVHRKMIDLVVNNENLEFISQEIANLIQHPVIIEDVHLHTIAHAGFGSRPVFPGRLEETMKNLLRNAPFYQDMLRGVVKHKAELILQDEPQIRNLMIPIHSHQTVYGFLSILYVDESYRLLDGIVMESGSLALSLLFMRQRIAEQTIQSKTASLIQDLIHSRLNTRLIRDPQFRHMDWSKPLYIVVMETCISTEAQYDIWNRTNGAVQQIIQAHFLHSSFRHHLIGFNGNIITILTSVPTLTEMPNRLSEAVTAVIQELEEKFDCGTCKAGISKECRKMANFGTSYQEAMEALATARTFPELGAVVSFGQLGIHRVLALITDMGKLQAFTADLLAPLTKYDAEHGEDLTKTLHVYLTQNGSISKAAKELFVHPNTVQYRLRKIHSILNKDFAGIDVRVTYLIALKAANMLAHMNATAGQSEKFKDSLTAGVSP